MQSLASRNAAYFPTTPQLWTQLILSGIAEVLLSAGLALLYDLLKPSYSVCRHVSSRLLASSSRVLS
ncbi:MAG: hypothetical protein B6D68_00625 [spirochete symbiont of Stewartia floridana]|nr:MAG: hypothetical protein B6D68_00625 [spirochete symbiont of Stewartia floridana]